MKFDILGLQKKILWIISLCFSCLVGCSILKSVGTPTSSITSSEAPTEYITVTPTSSLLTGKIAFLGDDGVGARIHLFIMQLDSGTITDITPPNLSLLGNISWSPDGHYIAFDALKGGVTQIFRMNTDGADLVQLTFGENDAYRPSWSPSGENILFASSQQSILENNGLPAQQIYIMQSDGSDEHRLIIDSKADNQSLSGSYRTDGLIAVSEPVTRSAVKNYIVNPDGIIQKQYSEFVTTSPISWSPNGEFVIYTSDRATSNCLGFFIMKTDNLEISCLNISDDSMRQQKGQMVSVDGASWSPDGKHIVFTSNLDGDTDLYIIRPDGTGLLQITNLPGNEGGAVWAP